MTGAPKKTEKLEVRLSPEAKASFLALCRSQGGSASEVVRALIMARRVRATELKALPMIHRVLIALCAGGAASFALASLASAGLALQTDLRAGLTVFLIVQGALYVAIAVTILRLNWRDSVGLMAVQCLLQTVYGAEVSPPAPAADVALGVLLGMLSPTIAVVVMAVVAWTAFRRGLLK